MSGPRHERILASTALALMLAAPLGALAQDRGSAPPAKAEAGKLAAVPATEQAAASDPMTSLDPADRAVAEKIRDLLAAKPDRIFAGKKERSAIEAFYQNRNFAPLWLDRGSENARATSVFTRLKNADADGLERSDYKTPNFAGPGSSGLDALAEAELKLTATVLTYARHLQAGRFPYNRVSHNIELPQAPPEPADILARIANAADPGKALEEFSPQHEPYRRLKAMLADMRGKSGAAGGEIAQGPVLTHDRKNQMEDPRVPALRDRLKLTGDASDLRYDASLAEAVKKFQRANELLPATGNLDARTIRELNGPTHDRQIDTVIANMERWRWYPRDLGNAHVIVNQPDFTLKVEHNGAQVWSTRIVIGKPSMATPLLSETMKHITINPTWNVPPSIVHNEYLPALAQDPTVLARMGMRVSYGRGGVHISQPPGDGNALGRIRFNFPNRFLVYQHDTPDKHMFGHDVRAYSHGCMRVQDPAKYAETLFNIARPDEHWTAEKVKSMFGSAEQDIQLQPAPIWVHLTYQSAFVDDAGKLQIRRDVYNLDSRTLAAIKSERAVIEPATERKREPEVASTSTSGRRSARSSRGSFFQSMFHRGPSYARPRPPRGIFYR